MTVRLSPTAAREIERQRTVRDRPNSLVHLSVRTGGCSGLYYVMDLVDTAAEGDRICYSGNLTIAIDASSTSYLENLALDYGEDLMGGSFRFQNPQAIQHCSCGHSFKTASD
ncbi:Iron-sulfur cluster assembly accessory protein [Rubidibacter lacunae KORDI 51-2]|uniref:Iron-sulfur cluster assembly accessory protein n=1 Tax=Rubidibacter lacunae KORDI 51-2 TaxID=582515 RepID=U5DQ37_9CHRO|nr:iron-sulfur cluster assembly accessory protein [Rubidibacter lacunae]ERN42719.1 Iron-sulfur cluster assembly accessory protein [Rubidibacter lacunae KORDI 51-2]